MTITISIGSGKGGTGKSTIIANLALSLARAGRRVCLVDLDLGGANAHILLGLFEPKRTLTDFITRKVETIQEVIHTFYSYSGLQLVPGTGKTLQTSNITYQEKLRLLRGIRSIDTDILLIDIGAGTSYHSLDFFMFSDIQICVTQPDPTSIMDLYTFLTLATIRKVMGSFLSQSELGTALKNNQFNSLNEVFELAEKSSPGARGEAQAALKYFHPLLIINRENRNGRLNTEKLQKMIAKYLGIELPTLGVIPDDDRVDEALKAFLPVCELYPESEAAMALASISTKLARIVDLFVAKRSPHNDLAEVRLGA